MAVGRGVFVGGGVSEGIGVKGAVGGIDVAVFSKIGETSVFSLVSTGVFVGKLHEKRKSAIRITINNLRVFIGTPLDFIECS